jgi:hypothetical protein
MGQPNDVQAIMDEARARLGEVEYRRRIDVFRNQMSADEQAARIAAEVKAEREKRDRINLRRTAALQLAEATTQVRDMASALLEEDKRLRARGLSDLTAKKLASVLPEKLLSLNVQAFVAEIGEADAAVSAELCK